MSTFKAQALVSGKKNIPRYNPNNPVVILRFVTLSSDSG